ncbi:MAG: hypothetical protein A2W91_17235 [Bacteroidetes bacterium GWF2_38_335]|nr:MAG: hypothetical protein A2W91_17235 [Bacteroidetes bacterium GWF2_38_335]OFY81425.1 MAG: hypothetical protein A2281_08210 [Bacteroidetes bacterium RIFOXYA12_FULL_38_20]HBS85554.1 hypothetical protein [Bacteroidales bacterium]
MKSIILALFIFPIINVYCQDKMVIIYTDTINCKIKEISEEKIKYTIEGVAVNRSKAEIVSYKKAEDLNFTIVNPYADQLVINHDSMSFVNKNSKLVRGVYQSIDEFIFNYPTIRDDFSFTKRKVFYKNKITKLKRDRIFGFCYNDSIYIRGYKKYNLVTEIGPLCYFEEKAIKYYIFSTYKSFGIIPIPYTDRMIVDLKNRKIFELKKKMLNKYLNTYYPDLYEQFMKEKHKKRQFLKYIKLINESGREVLMDFEKL